MVLVMLVVKEIPKIQMVMQLHIYGKKSYKKIIYGYYSTVYEFRSEEKNVLIFPRYHQLDVVTKLVAECEGKWLSGKNYLIQHSAGSGKSNSIAWLAYHLASLHDKDNKASLFCYYCYRSNCIRQSIAKYDFQF